MGYSIYFNLRYLIKSELYLPEVREKYEKMVEIFGDDIEVIENEIVELTPGYSVKEWLDQRYEPDGLSRVDPKIISELVEICQKILDDPSLAETLLPREEEERSYLSSLKKIVKVFPPILKKIDEGYNYSIRYVF